MTSADTKKSIAPKTWPDRNETAKRTGKSRSTVIRMERNGELVWAYDEDGVVRHNPEQFSREPDSAERSTRTIGERTGAVVALLRRGATVADAVEQCREPFEFVRAVQRDLISEERGFIVTAVERGKIEALVANHFRTPRPVPDAPMLLLLLEATVPAFAENGSLKADLDKVRESYARLEGEREALRGELNTATDNVSELECRLERVTAARDIYRREANNAFVDAEVAEQRAEEAVAERDAALERVQALEREVDELREQDVASQPPFTPGLPGSEQSGEGHH